MAWVVWDLAKRVRTPRQAEENIEWVPLKPTCVSFENKAPNNKSMKDSRWTRNYMIEETGWNCCVVEVASKVSQDDDKNPCSSDNNHITTLLWSSKIMMKDQHPRSTHKLNRTGKKSFFKRIFLFQNFVWVDTTWSEIEQPSILKSCLMDSHFRDMSS
jgi:hypothetical protein